MPTSTTTFGDELRRWRRHRRFSQEQLALRAEVSQRHLSYLENGRSKPSPEMVDHLARTLDISPRAQNELRGAAGFAPRFSREPLDGEALADVRRSLDALLAAHAPFPAYVVDRLWNLSAANEPAAALVAAFADPGAPPDVVVNTLKLVLHPLGLRPYITNWKAVAGLLLARLDAEIGANPNDTELRGLRDEVQGYDGVGAVLDDHAGRLSPGDQLVTELHVRFGDRDLRLYTAIMSILAPADVTLSELRLETLLPADAATEAALRELV